MAASTFKFVQVEAFRDLSIAAASLCRVPESELERFSLLISPHLRALADALATRCRVETLPITERFTPACWLASRLDGPLVQAVQNVVPVFFHPGDTIEALRQWASGRCLPGVRVGMHSRPEGVGYSS